MRYRFSCASAAVALVLTCAPSVLAQPDAAGAGAASPKGTESKVGAEPKKKRARVGAERKKRRAKADAEPKKKRAKADAAAKAKPEAPADPLARATAALDGPSAAEVKSGLEQMVAIGKPACVQPVMDRLARGLPPLLAREAMQTLALLGDARAHRVLTPMLGHRRPALRATAVQTLGLLRARAAYREVVAALDDPAPEVRKEAIDALTALGDRRAIAPLSEAVAAGEPGAAAALGALSGPGDLGKLVKLAQRTSFTAVQPAFSALRARPGLALGVKVSMARRLAVLDGDDVEAFLKGLLENLPASGGKAMMRAVDHALQTIHKRAEKAAAKGASQEGAS